MEEILGIAQQYVSVDSVSMVIRRVSMVWVVVFVLLLLLITQVYCNIVN